MADFPFESTRGVSPAGSKHVAFENKCQIIPEGDCAELRKLLSLCPTRAQSPPIAGSSSRPTSLIARTISPQLGRKSPQLGLGGAPPNTSTSWRTRLASWGSHDTSNTTRNVSSSSASSTSAQPTSQPTTISGPRLVAPVPARGASRPLNLGQNDDLDEQEEDGFVHISPSPANESAPDFDDINAEFRQAVSGVAMQPHSMRIETIAEAGPSAFQPPRSYSPVVRSISELRYQRPSSVGGRPKSCLVRSRTPQAPGPPRLLMDDGMSPLRATRSNDADHCVAPRRRADGVPVVKLGPSPLSSPEDESGWSAAGHANEEKPKLARTGSQKTKLSRWKRFRRTASEDTQLYESSSNSTDKVKSEIQAGRWPFEAPLNVECSCKNCQDRIERGLASNYEPKWTRAARIRWLEAQEDASAPKSSSPSSSSSGRVAIQADEVAQLHNETVHPMSSAELAEEPTSPVNEQGHPLTHLITSTNVARAEDDDESLRREIMARRQQKARQSPVLRHGARSMMRQLEEAERIEREAARSRSQSREGKGGGSGRSSPASPTMSPSMPSTPESECVSVSTTATPQERGGNEYFTMNDAPPERVRSPLIPADAMHKTRYARPVATGHVVQGEGESPFSMQGVVQSLDAIACSTGPSTSPHKGEGNHQILGATPSGRI